LGSLKAMKKASVAPPTGNTQAKTMSRIRPKIRDSRVMALTTAVDFRRPMAASPGDSQAFVFVRLLSPKPGA